MSFRWGYVCVDVKSLILAKRPDITNAKLGTASLLKQDNREDLFLDTISIGAYATVTDFEGTCIYIVTDLLKLNTFKLGIVNNLETIFVCRDHQVQETDPSDVEGARCTSF